MYHTRPQRKTYNEFPFLSSSPVPPDDGRDEAFTLAEGRKNALKVVMEQTRKKPTCPQIARSYLCTRARKFTYEMLLWAIEEVRRQ